MAGSYKDTLNLPQTAFDMRANLLTKEPAIQARWKEQDLYGRIRKARANAKRFILHDGPPYANGDIHMGTSLNKILKDMVVRIKNMSGFDSPYVPGWDCHGLPIEYKVQSEVGPALVDMSNEEIRRRCTEYARHWVQVQSDQFQRLGVMGQFDKPYITMSPAYEASVLEVLAMLVEQGLVYRQLKPVHWSIENRTALAEAELEYADRKDESIFVFFAVDDPQALRGLLGLSGDQPINLMIWTTTPWTLPANMAVAVHPDFEYAAVEFEFGGRKTVAVIAADLIEKVLKQGGVEDYRLLGTIRGTALVEAGVHYRHPLGPRRCPVLLANYVTLEDGTGLVHTAPGHGLEDYGTGLKAGLEVYCPVLEDGTFDKTSPDWLVGKTVWQANPLVIDYLRQTGGLFFRQGMVHSYPHDWRSKTPTIFRATEQWFVAVDRPMKRGTTLRQMALEATQEPASQGGIDFVPAWGRNRLEGMLQSRPDWCISRQRSWGLPIPAFYDANGNTLMTPASVRAVAAHFARFGSDSWFIHSPAQLLESYDPASDRDLPKGINCHPDQLKGGRDILDVWFESGSSWYAVAVNGGLVKQPPVQLYLEGSDQHRGWFQLSLLPALGAIGKPPFSTLLTHGFVVTEQGTKMSKSLGNAIDAVEQLTKRGADVLRLWVASQNYQDDVRCSESLIAQAEDAYRKIRNTLRYCMGSCFDFDPAKDACDAPEHSLDRWMRMELHHLIRDVRQACDQYEFHRATRMIYEFCTIQASSIYMAAVKDRLYCELPDSPRRRATQTVLHEVLMSLVKLLAPILVHTCDEAWEHIPSRPADEPDNIHLAMLPDFDKLALDAADAVAPQWAKDMIFDSGDDVKLTPVMIWGRLMDLRQEGLLKLEALRNSGVKNALDAEAVFTVAQDDRASQAFLQMYLSELEDLLGVGYASIQSVPTLPQPGQTQPSQDSPGRDSQSDQSDQDDRRQVKTRIQVEVRDSREKYRRCERSWKRRPDVGGDSEYPDLSARDAAVMRELKARGIAK